MLVSVLLLLVEVVLVGISLRDVWLTGLSTTKVREAVYPEI